MKITKEMLKNWNAYQKFLDWFGCRYPEGKGDYQAVLDVLAEDNRPEYALWLLEKAGADDSVTEVISISNCKNFFVAGALVVQCSVNVSGCLIAGSDINVEGEIKTGDDLRAGGSISAGHSIQSGWNIVAGKNIKAGGAIQAEIGIKAGQDINTGRNFGIFAGVRIPIDIWPQLAQVVAKTKPLNLISGSWVPAADSQQGGI